MSEDFVLHATSRSDLGKGASRRLRRLADQVPAIVYGGGNRKPVSISLSHKDLSKQLENEAFYSHIINLVIDDKPEDVILKDLQRHPAKDKVVHADFFRVSKTKKLQTSVPLHFINEDICKGVKLQGGNIVHNMAQLEVTCLPADLPSSIEIDMADLEIGQLIHISDVKLPKGVEAVALLQGVDHDQPVATVNKPRGGSEEDAETEADDSTTDSE